MTYTKPYLDRIVAPHEPDYWTAQADGFRLVRLLEEYLHLTDLCGRAFNVATTGEEEDFFEREHDRFLLTARRIARHVARCNGYTILQARADDSWAYRMVVKRQHFETSAEYCARKKAEEQRYRD